MNSKKVTYTIVSIVVLLIAVSIFIKLVGLFLSDFETVYDSRYDKYTTETLNNQNNFKMIGTPIYNGLGASTTFAFRMSEAGDNYGVDFFTDKAKNRFTGYMTLVDSSTTTKVFAGKMLDRNNNTVDGVIKIYRKDCKLPKIKPVSLSVEAQLGDRMFEGCADMAR